MPSPLTRRSLLGAGLGVGSLALAACSGGDAPGQSAAAPDPDAHVVLRDPDVVAASGARAALLVSAGLFERARVAVVAAGEADHAAAAEVAQRLRVPALPGDADGLTEELERLSTEVVRTVGEPEGGWGDRLGDREATTEDPDVRVDDPARGLTLLVATKARLDDPSYTLAVATARAAGAGEPVVVAGDPRGTDRLADFRKDVGDTRVVAIGPGLGPDGSSSSPEAVEHRLTMALGARELPGGGVLPFPGRHLVALYGQPRTPALGVLGEQGPGGAVKLAKRYAKDYASLVDGPVQPAFEIIATTALGSPGKDNLYSGVMPPGWIEPWVDAAEKAGILVILDLQPGRASMLDQAKKYERLLARPHVGLALDPEWKLTKDQLPLQQIGSVDVAEINEVGDWLAALVTRKNLPQKIFTIHQFRLDMIRHRGRLASWDELATVIHVDGSGTPGMKFDTWRAIRQDMPAGVHLGWKNFIDEDTPMLTPRQTVEQVKPFPALITYQ